MRIDLEAQAVARESVKYTNAVLFLRILQSHLHELSLHEYRVLREQALNGDVEGARQALANLLKLK